MTDFACKLVDMFGVLYDRERCECMLRNEAHCMCVGMACVAEMTATIVLVVLAVVMLLACIGTCVVTAKYCGHRGDGYRLPPQHTLVSCTADDP